MAHAKFCQYARKYRFRDHREAVRALHRALNARHAAALDHATTRRREIRTYFCRACKGWHLTSAVHWSDPVRAEASRRGRSRPAAPSGSRPIGRRAPIPPELIRQVRWPAGAPAAANDGQRTMFHHRGRELMRPGTPASKAEDIARVWFEVTDQTWDDGLFQYFADEATQHPMMANADMGVITLAGRAVFARSNSLMMPAWAAEAERVQAARKQFGASAFAQRHGLRFSDWWPRQGAIAALDRWCVDTGLLELLTRVFGLAAVQEARDLLIERVLTGAIGGHDGTLRPLRYKPHLDYADSRALPVIGVPQTEVVILHLLALTHPALQFFYDKHGQPVPGFANGYHGTDRPAAVTGMSLILDAAGAIVEDHRHGTGGRIYISRNRVVCPAHRHNLATVDVSA